MFDYDATLKIQLKGSASVTIHALSGLTITRWHDVELPTVEERRVDLLGESGDGRLLHIELQSTNDPAMALRMAEYGVKVARWHGRYPKQVLLYVGEVPLRMASEYRPNEDVSIRYGLVDIRELDGEQLLHSDGLGDNVIAILARLGNQRRGVRQIVDRIANLDASVRRATLEQLLILAGLRHLGPLVREEASRMPITENILDHEFIGPAYKKGREEGLQEGLQEGREEGREEGRQAGELAILRRQIGKRFGPIPAWLEERLAHCSTSDLEELSERVLDAQSLEDLVR